MAFITANHTTSVSLFDRATEAFTNLRKANADHRLFVRTMRELNSLSNRELADLGMSRGGLRSVAYEAVYGA